MDGATDEAEGRARDREAVRARVQAIQADLVRRDLAAARRGLDDAPAAWRARPALVMLEARLLLAEGRPAEAEAACRARLAAESGGTAGGAAAAVMLCRAVARQGRLGEARDLYLDAVAIGAAAPEVRAALLAELTATGPAEEIDAFLRRAEAARPLSRAERMRLAASDARRGRPDRALGRLGGAPDGPEPSRAQRAQRLRLLLQTGRLPEAAAELDALAAREPDDPEWRRRRAQLRRLQGDDDGALALLLDSAARWPNDAELLRELSRQTLDEPQARAALERLRAARAGRPPGAMASYVYAQLALQVGETAEALRAFAEVDPRSGLLHLNALSLRAALAVRPAAAWDAPGRVGGDLGRPVQVARAPGARVTLFVFNGLGNRFGGLPPRHVDAVLAGLPAHVVYVSDLDRNAYLGGPRGLGRTPEAIAAAMAALAADLGAPRIATAGSSSGGFGALRLGALAGARAAASFSGPTKLFAPDDADRTGQRPVGLAYLRALPESERDALPALRARPDLRVWHVAGARHAEDLHQQGRLAGLPGLQSETIPGLAEHNTVTPLVAEGRLAALLARVVEAAA